METANQRECLLSLMLDRKERHIAGHTEVKSNFSLDRRQLLTTAAAVTVAGVLPTEPTEAATPAEAEITPATIPELHAPALKVCASTARRIEEIVARSRIRQEAGLPLLSIAKELRRMKTVERAAKFKEFVTRHWEEVWEEVLAAVREAKGEPHWRPTRWMEGLAFQSKVSKIMRERFIAQEHKGMVGMNPGCWP